MKPVGTLAYTMSSGSVDFMLYNTVSEGDQVQWVYWRRGVSSHELQDHLFGARVILEWDGQDYTYDFATGRYREIEADSEAGWIQPDACLDHSGGSIARFGVNADLYLSNGHGGYANATLSTLHDLVLDSESPLKVEIRSRPTASAEWHTRSHQLLTKTVEEPNVRTREVTRKVAVAA